MTDTVDARPDTVSADLGPDDGEQQRARTDGTIFLAAVVVLAVALIVTGRWPILLLIGAVTVMIIMHELGHYLTAKKSGMKVTEFFLGFGPRLWSFHRGETEYGVKAFWLGAYVKIPGMSTLEEVAPEDEARSYRAATYPRRVAVASAGSAMHFLMAFVLAFVAFTAYGVSDSSNWQVTELSTADEVSEQFRSVELDDDFQALLDEGSTPARAARLESGDRIVGADDEQFDDFSDVQDFILTHPGEDVTFAVERDGEVIEVPAQIGLVTDGEHTKGFLGFSHEESSEQLGPIDAAQESASFIGTVMSKSVEGIGRLFSPSGISAFAESVFSEPTDDEPEAQLDDDGISAAPSSQDGRVLSIVGFVRLGAEQTDENGMEVFLTLMVLLNVFIGLFNLIPLLPFDGGHIAIATYERIREIGHKGRYHADLTRMMPVAYAVILIMLTIGVLAIYSDIFNWQDFG